MNIYHIINGQIELYRNAMSDRPEVYSALVDVGMQFEGQKVYCLDWSIGGGECRMTYQMRNDAYAPIHDGRFPCRVVRENAKPPRGKGWQWVNGRWERRTSRGREQAIA